MKPYIICHMMSTLDGRTVTKDWNYPDASKIFEAYHEKIGVKSWMCGRVTIEKDFAGTHKLPKGLAKGAVPRTDFVADAKHGSYAVSVDPSGRIVWQTNETGGDHVIEVLTEDGVSDDYLAYLQSKKVSYIFAGKDAIDYAAAFEKLNALFGIDKLMLEGGGHNNGSVLRAGLVDEISLLILPRANGAIGAATLFDAEGDVTTKLELVSNETQEGGVIWLRYKVLN